MQNLQLQNTYHKKISLFYFLNKYQKAFLNVKNIENTKNMVQKINAYTLLEDLINHQNNHQNHFCIYDLEWQSYDEILSVYQTQQEAKNIEKLQNNQNNQNIINAENIRKLEEINFFQFNIPLVKLIYQEDEPLKLQAFKNTRKQIILFISPTAIYGFDYFLKKHLIDFNVIFNQDAKLFCMGHTSRQLLFDFWQRAADTSPQNHAQSLFDFFKSKEGLNILQDADILIIQGDYEGRKSASDTLKEQLLNLSQQQILNLKIITFQSYRSAFNHIWQNDADISKNLKNLESLQGLQGLQSLQGETIFIFSLLKSSQVAKEISKLSKLSHVSPFLIFEKMLQKKQLYFCANYDKIFESLDINDV